MRHEIVATLHSVGVPLDKVDACMEWAFGEDWYIEGYADADEEWNARHGDLFVIKGEDRVKDSLERIGKAFMEREERSKEESENVSKESKNNLGTG